MNDNIVNSIDKRLKQTRMTRWKLARLAGYQPVRLNQFMRGERKIQSDVLNRICDVLGLSLQPEAMAESNWEEDIVPTTAYRKKTSGINKKLQRSL